MEDSMKTSNLVGVNGMRNPEDPVYKDIFFAIIFLAQAFFVLCLSISSCTSYFGIEYPDEKSTYDGGSKVISISDGDDTTGKIIGGVVLLGILGVISSLLVIYTIARFVSKVVAITFVITISVSMAVAIGFLATQAYLIGILVAVFVVVAFAFFNHIRYV